MKAFLIALALLVPASIASAQTVVIDPTTVEFVASPDHAAVYPDGTFVLTRYGLNASSSTPGAVPIVDFNLGKPTPDPTTGKITINLATLFATLTAGATYTATVTAVGPGGTETSAPSNPFARAFPLRAPGAPTSVKVTKPT